MIDKKTIVGGTFDLFHKGHETLLENAFKLGIVVVGLTSNKMALQRKQREVEDYKERENSILRFANSQNKNIKIKKLKIRSGLVWMTLLKELWSQKIIKKPQKR